MSSLSKNQIDKFLNLYACAFISVFPVISLYLHNFSEVNAGDIFYPLLTAFLIALVPLILSYLYFREIKMAAISSSCILIFFYSYAHFRNLLIINSVFADIAYLLLLILLIFFIQKFRSFSDVLSILLISLALYLTVYSVGTFFYSEYKAKIIEKKSDIFSPIEIPFKKPGLKPNIFFLVVDAYGRGDILKDLYDFNNSGFLQYLKSRDFFIVQNSTSNYSLTELSIASTLNLQYLTPLTELMGEETSDKSPLKYCLNNNVLFRFLKNYDYHTVSISTNSSTEVGNADLLLKPDFNNVLSSYFYTATPFSKLIKHIKMLNPFEKYRNSVLYSLNPAHFETLCKNSLSPFILYDHITLPHPPFVFGPMGEPVNLAEHFNFDDGSWLIKEKTLTSEAYKKHYTDQIVFLNEQLKQIMNVILSNSKNPPVIVLTSDHGPRSQLIWENIEHSNMKECMSTLSAVYFPDKDYQDLNNHLSNVNIFRIILNHFFNTELKILENKNYYSAENLYCFTDVSSKIKNLNNELLPYSRGLEFFKKSDFQNALKEFLFAHNLNPEDSDINCFVGKCHYYLNQYKDAVLFFKRAISISSRDVESYNYLGFSYYNLEEYARAVNCLEKTILSDPEYLMGYYYISKSYLQMRDFNKAEKYYEKIKSKDASLADELLIAIQKTRDLPLDE